MNQVEKIESIRCLTQEKLRQQMMVGLAGMVIEEMTIEQAAEFLSQDMYLAIARLNVAASKRVIKSKPTTHPATWWDAIKERWFPRMKYTKITHEATTTIYHVCPHLPMPSCDRNTHLLFMEGVQQRGVEE